MPSLFSIRKSIEILCTSVFFKPVFIGIFLISFRRLTKIEKIVKVLLTNPIVNHPKIGKSNLRNRSRKNIERNNKK